MSRDLNSSTKTASLAAAKNIAVLMEAEFDSGAVNVFGGYGTLTIGSTTYTGSGDLIKVDPAQESADIQAAGASVQLSGVQSTDIALALTEIYQGRTCRMKLAFFDADMVLIGDPVTIFEGRMDVMNLLDDPKGGPLITLSAESELIRLSTASHRNRTHEDQQIDYPGDLGLEFVPSMQNKIIYV